MRVLLTGASGFVGQNLLTYLSNSIFTISILSRSEIPENIFEKMSACDAIIHLAGKAHDLSQKSDPLEYDYVNYQITRKIFDAFAKSDAKKFFFMSSVKASADKVDGILSETDIPDPKTDYGKSKLKAEEYIMSVTLAPEKSCYILRPCMIHGLGNKGNLNLLYQFVKKGIPYPLAAFKNQRSFLSIENLCFVIKKLLENDIPSGIYQLADDESFSTNELVSEIALNLDLKPNLWAIPPNLIKSVAKLGDKLRLPLNTERLNKLTENYTVSNEKIKKALGRELPISAKEGLQKTIQSFKA